MRREPYEVELMRYAGAINDFVLKRISELVRPGISAALLDEYAETLIYELGAQPAFKGYAPDGTNPYPYTITCSIDSEIVHGLPLESKVFREGQIVSLDCGTAYKGYYSDSAITVGVGRLTSAKRRLIRVTKRTLQLAVEILRAGMSHRQFARRIQTFAESQGYSVVRRLTGHGVGTALHEPPEIPNYVIPGFNFIFESGMTVAIEPMLSAGSPNIRITDNWAIVTEDGSDSAHFEHTLLIKEGGCEPLTVVTPELEEKFLEKVRKVIQHYEKVKEKTEEKGRG